MIYIAFFKIQIEKKNGPTDPPNFQAKRANKQTNLYFSALFKHNYICVTNIMHVFHHAHEIHFICTLHIFGCCGTEKKNLLKQSTSAQSYDRKRHYRLGTRTHTYLFLMQKANAFISGLFSLINVITFAGNSNISKAEILNYCRRFRESVKCKCKETEFYKISYHNTPSILKRIRKF